MGVLSPRMTLTCYKVATTRNAAGDLIYGSETELACWFRDITDISINDQNRERTDSDALLWVEPDSGVVKGDIIKFEDVYFRVERLTNARRLPPFGTEIQFIKCELLKVRQTS